MKSLFIIVLICFVTLAQGQSKKFKAFADSVKTEKNSLIEEYSLNDFFSSGLADKELDVLDIDQNLLNATVFYTFNKFRKKRRRKELLHSEPLNKSSLAYAGYYRSSSFRTTEGNKRKSSKAGKYTAKQYGFTGAFVEVIIAKPAVLDKQRLKNFYHDIKATKENGDDVGLYYGEKPKKGDTTEQTPIPNYTYSSFAETVVKQWFVGMDRRITKSKAIKYGSCCIILDEKSLFKSKMPYAKAIIVVGGYRTELLPDERQKTSTDTTSGN